MPQLSASEWAQRQVEAVRDDPEGRLALLERTYRGPTGDAPQHLPFRRAAAAFVKWQIARGVLAPIEGEAPGSPWWRAVNERLLREGCEAVARIGGSAGVPSSASAGLWSEFAEHPSRRTWYRAHNATIVSGFLEHRDLASRENHAERFFLNVVLLRVLYAHALVAVPRFALGALAFAGPLLGDPRLAFTGVFLSLSRILPDRYPLQRDVAEYVADEHAFGRLLDFGLVQSRLQDLYAWSAEELGEPGLLELIDDGSPSYEWADRGVWIPGRRFWSVRAVQAVIPHRRGTIVTDRNLH